MGKASLLPFKSSAANMPRSLDPAPANDSQIKTSGPQAGFALGLSHRPVRGYLTPSSPGSVRSVP